jgi:hypothetical protein
MPDEPSAQAALVRRISGESNSPFTVIRKNRIGPKPSSGGPSKTPAGSTVLLPSNSEKKPWSTTTPAWLSTQPEPEGRPLPEPSTIANIMLYVPVRGLPIGSVSRPW